MKRKKKTSLKSSSQQLVKEETYLYLPDECWESIFNFIITDDSRRCLNSLSHVSKQFLSVANSLLFSLTVYNSTLPFLKRLLKRFTNLTSLDICYSIEVDNNLRLISSFPLKKLTSLRIRNRTFLTNGLRAFSQNITTLTSITCYNMILYDNDLLLIADCFPLLKELKLEHPSVNDKTNFINGFHYLLSKCQGLQHLDLEHTYFLKDQHVVDLSSSMGNLVSINLSRCWHPTETTLFSLVRNCPSLSEIKMESNSIGIESVGYSDSLVQFCVYPQLKSLYLGNNRWLSDENIIMFASIFPNLQHLDLRWCERISEGICQVLRRCCKLKHLNLASCSKVKLHGMNFEVPKLEVLDLSNTSVDDETLYVISKNCCKLKHLNLASCSKVKLHGMNIDVPKLEVLDLSNTSVDDKTLYAISKNCCGLLQLLLYNCDNVTHKGVKHVVEKCTQLGK